MIVHGNSNLDTLLLEEMTWPQIAEALRRGMRTVVIYAGAVEQHGKHLAENTDTVRAYAEAEDLAKKLGSALVAPVIRPGMSDPHMCLPGSVSLRKETFQCILEDYISAYIQHGFETIILASTHGGNITVMKETMNQSADKYPYIRFAFGYDMADIMQLLTTCEKEEGLAPGTCGGHACDFETSVMLHIAPNFVQMEVADVGYIGGLTDEITNKVNKEGMCSISPNGVMGNPIYANSDRGKRYFDKLQCLQHDIIHERTEGQH